LFTSEGLTAILLIVSQSDSLIMFPETLTE